MIKERYELWQEHEYSYPMAYGFRPNIVTYRHQDEPPRPALLIAPGGGYGVVSPTEGEIVAEEFYRRGYQAFVLTYTTNLLSQEPLRLQPLKDISRAVRLIRKQAENFRVDPQRLVVCGFSAGGHLCASLCVHYDDVSDGDELYRGISNRPDAAVLAYPVISADDWAHVQSYRNLFGQQPAQSDLDYMSLEHHVTAVTPPSLIWQAVDDQTVPVENSYCYANACRKQGVLFAHHVFSGGGHGVSLANQRWADGEYGEPYTMDQTERILERVRSGQLPLPEAQKEQLLASFSEEQQQPARTPLPEIEVWPELADRWLEVVFTSRKSEKRP